MICSETVLVGRVGWEADAHCVCSKNLAAIVDGCELLFLGDFITSKYMQ